MRKFGYQPAALAVAAILGLTACGGESAPAGLSAEAEPTEDVSETPTTEATAAADTDANSGQQADDAATEPAAEPVEEAEEAEKEAPPVDPEEAAEANLPLLTPADNVLDYEVLDVADGSIATLGEAVVGDRPVLLWFFSPH